MSKVDGGPEPFRGCPKLFLLKMKCIVHFPTWIEWGLFRLTVEISAVQEPLSTKKRLHVESVDLEEQGQPLRPFEQQEKNVYEKVRQQRALHKAGSGKKYKPCPRWKNLGLVFSHGYMIIPLVKYWQPGVGNSSWKDKTVFGHIYFIHLPTVTRYICVQIFQIIH